MFSNPYNREFFVCAYGSDCDGYNSGHIYQFSTEQKAQQFCDKLNAASDGLYYEVEDRGEAERYCSDFGISLPDYLTH